MRSSTPLLKNMLARGLLALAFLFAQHTASLHWLSHAVDATQAKAGKSAPVPDHCDECLLLVALGAGATSDNTALPIPAAQHALLATVAPVASPAALRLAFDSRAPPVLN